jgi:hypothetical protein
MLSLVQAARLTTSWLLLMALISSIVLRSKEPLSVSLTIATPSFAKEPLAIALRGTTR